MKGEELRKKILETIEKEWPISITQIAISLGLYKEGLKENKRKAAVAKIIYHVRKMKDDRIVQTKKIGKTVIIWPTEIEKIRVLHEMLK
jgi:DNA-binding Lrp family transcriptional regulator